jgi:hypothetical protein
MLVFTVTPMIFAPLAGIGSELLMKAGVGYTSLVPPFIVAGIGISFVFPTMANAAVGAVPVTDSGVAAGSNNTMQQSGGCSGSP